MNGMLATLPFVQSGKLKVLGVSKATRVPLLPERADDRRAGRAGLRVGHLAGRCWCRRQRRPTVVARLSTELTRIIRSPEVRSRLTAQGAEVYTMSPAEFATFFERERKRWAGGRRRGRRQARLTHHDATTDESP